MMTVHKVSEMTGVSIRALQHYDNIGLLHPTQRTGAGYRLYDEAALERLQQILLFRELEFPLKEIAEIVDAPGFDRIRALDQQIELLTLKRDHVQSLIDLAQKMKEKGVGTLDFKAFDTSRIDEYAAQAKASWGNTPEYREFEEKDRDRMPDERQEIFAQMMGLFVEFGALKDGAPDSPEVCAQVKSFRTSSAVSSTSAPTKCWQASGRCTAQAAISRSTSTRRRARARLSSPPGQSRPTAPVKRVRAHRGGCLSGRKLLSALLFRSKSYIMGETAIG